MAKSKTQNQENGKKKSPFVKFNEIGETVEGVFSHYSKTKGLQKTDQNPEGEGRALVLVDGRMIGLSTDLVNKFKELGAKIIPQKSKVRIQLVSINEKNKFHEYLVTVDGKELKGTFGEKIGTSQEEIENFFN